MKTLFFLFLMTLLFAGCSTADNGAGGVGSSQYSGSGGIVPGDSTTRAFPSAGRVSTGAH